MGFEIMIGHVSPLKAPLATAFGRSIKPATLAAEGHAPVAKEIFTLPGLVAAAIDGTTNHVYTIAILTLEFNAVIVLDDWGNHFVVGITELRVVIRVEVIEALISFQYAPAVVATTGNDVHFLVTVLLNVGHEELVLAAGVEGHPPGIPKAICEDLTPSTLLINKRIVRWNSVLKTIRL